MEANLVGWFEIPVVDMPRAQKFYETVFGVKIHVEKFGDTLIGWFPFPKDPKASGAGGALVKNSEFYHPSDKGTLIYFASAEITNELAKVVEEGGKIIQEKTLISDEIGYMALFLDCEGNRIALHSKD